MASASFQISQDNQGRHQVRLLGQWSLRAIENDFSALKSSLEPFFADPFTQWDLREVEQLDSAAAAILLSGWNQKIDQRIQTTEEQSTLLHLLKSLPPQNFVQEKGEGFRPISNFGQSVLNFKQQLIDFVMLIGLIILEITFIIKHPRIFPAREFSANIYKSGVMALPITALLGFMIGVAMSFLMARQLRIYGADIFIVNILGLGIIRELGPILMAVLIAGRSGSAMTAQIGVMRVTEEIDALTTMGISKILRIVFPKMIALTLVAPFLVLWTSFWGLAGGALSANIELDISFKFFFEYLALVVPAANLSISLVKGLMFGLVVTLVACHFGLRIKPNTESLSASTTSSVVTAITAVILIDAGFAILTRGLGI